MSLRFPSQALEAEFQARFARDALPRYRAVMPIITLMWVAFGLFDSRIFSGEQLDEARIVRYLIILPVLLGSLAFSWAARQVFARYWQWVVATGYAAMMAGMIYLTTLVEPSRHSQGPTAISLVLVGGYTLVMLRFVFAVVVSAVASVVASVLFALRFQEARLMLDTMDTGMVWILMANMIGMLACYELEKFRRYKFVQELTIEKERQRAEALLSNTLPARVIERLKAGETRPVDAYQNVTVVFADLVGFTKAASLLPPHVLVDRLDDLFTEFDHLAERHGLEKIKTIGDEYMVVVGVPDSRDDHAVVAARFALDVLDAVTQRRQRARDSFDVRIGIHSGPVVAGVIGVHRLHYDVWGDTVNIASRMQSHGIPGAIQISASTQQLLGEEFDTERRGTVEIKGKGPMTTYILRGQRVAQVSDAMPSDFDVEDSDVEHTDVR